MKVNTFHCMLTVDKEYSFANVGYVIRLLVERILNVHLVPYNLPVSERMRKLLKLYCTLDEHSVK